MFKKNKIKQSETKKKSEKRYTSKYVATPGLDKTKIHSKDGTTKIRQSL